MNTSKLNTTLIEYITKLNWNNISEERLSRLRPLVKNIKGLKDNGKPIQLNFICTHNSRRSHLSQVWAIVAAEYFNINAKCFSSGTEATSIAPQTIAVLQKVGLKAAKTSDGTNPEYQISIGDKLEKIRAFSKVIDHPINPKDNFTAVMTCSDADENCPFVAGAQKRIALNYQDPKTFDNTDKESQAYLERCNQIATEMLYVFSKV